MGALMVPLPYLLRAQLGRVAAFSAAVALAFGPVLPVLQPLRARGHLHRLHHAALLVVTFRFLERPRRHQPALIGALLALSFATKESTFITVFVAGTFFIAALALQVAPARLPRRAAGAHRRGASGGRRGSWGLAAFALVFTVLFTVFLTNPGGLWDGIYEGLKYWLAQHGPGRGEKEWYFYIVVLFAEEWPALLLGAVGAVATLRRPTLLRAFLIWDFAALARRLLVGERALLVARAAPAAAAAAAGRRSASRRSGTRAGAGPAGSGSPSCSPALLYMGYASWWANVENGADPREFLVATQSAEQVKGVRDEVRAVAARARRDGRERAHPGRLGRRARRSRGRGTSATSAPATSTSRTPRSPPTRTSSMLTEGSRERLRGELAGYDGRRFPFRVWWVRDYGAMSPGAWWRWFTRREPWNPTGGLPEWLYVRQGA